MINLHIHAYTSTRRYQNEVRCDARDSIFGPRSQRTSSRIAWPRACFTAIIVLLLGFFFQMWFTKCKTISGMRSFAPDGKWFFITLPFCSGIFFVLAMDHSKFSSLSSRNENTHFWASLTVLCTSKWRDRRKPTSLKFTVCKCNVQPYINCASLVYQSALLWFWLPQKLISNGKWELKQRSLAKECNQPNHIHTKRYSWHSIFMRLQIKLVR